MNNEHEKIYTDKDGKRYILDENGNKLPPMQSSLISPNTSFSLYHTDDGHCAICGKLTCNGNCFK